jgi:hypothetical protein
MSVASFDLSEIFEEAFERAGMEMRGGYDVKKARRCFNMLTTEWANMGYNLWTVEQGTTAVVAGTATYTLDADTIDIIEHYIRDSNSRDYQLARIKLNEYASKVDKTLTTRGRPTQIFVQRLAATTPVILWPTPDASYTLVYWRLAAIDALSSGVGSGTSPDIPPRFVPAITLGLAFHLAQSYNESSGRIPFLQQEYGRQFDMAAGEDRDRTSVRLIPGGY